MDMDQTEGRNDDTLTQFSPITTLTQLGDSWDGRSGETVCYFETA